MSPGLSLRPALRLLPGAWHRILFAAALLAAPLDGQLAILADRVYPVSSPAIPSGAILIGEDGRIAAVGPASEISVPEGWEVLRAPVAIPGLVDARTVVGLSGILNQPHDQDQLDRSAAIQPELRAVDAYNGREQLVEWVRGLGVTTIHSGHAPGAAISGQTAIFKTDAADADRAVRVPLAMVACTLGQASTGGGGPGTRGKLVAVLRARLEKVRASMDKKDREEKEEEEAPGEGGERGKRSAASPGDRVLERVLRREIPLLATAHTAVDIMTALRLQEEFGFRLVLDGAAEAHLVLDAIKKAGVPVIAHPPMIRTSREAANATFRLGAILDEAGIPFAFQSGYESYVPKTRVVLFEAGIAAAYGLGFEKALRAITLEAAGILSIQDRVGSLEPGKDGDVALYDGDPFEYTTRCVGVVIEGKVVSRQAR